MVYRDPNTDILQIFTMLSACSTALEKGLQGLSEGVFSRGHGAGGTGQLEHSLRGSAV